MCAGAIVHTRFKRIVFGVRDPKGGAAGGALNLLQFPGLNHFCASVGGVCEDESKGLLKEFFALQRSRPKGSKSDFRVPSEAALD